MLESLPDKQIESITLEDIIDNRTKINEIIAYLSVVAAGMAPTPHIDGDSK